MKISLSPSTLNILRNFAQIDSAISISPGNLITIRNGNVNSIQARATVEETFPVPFAVHDLNQWLSILTLHRGAEPDIEFGERSMRISYTGDQHTDVGEVEYFYSDPTLIVAPDPAPPTTTSLFSFQLKQRDIATIEKTSAVLSSTLLNVTGDGEGVYMTLRQSVDDTSQHSYRKRVGSSSVAFQMALKMDLFKLLPQTYEVHLAQAHTKANRKVYVFLFESPTINYLMAADVGSVYHGAI